MTTTEHTPGPWSKMNITEDQIIAVLNGEAVTIEGLTLGWRTVHPDFRSSHGFRWPFPGQWVEADPAGREYTVGDPCPQFNGDGLCIATTWAGAASGGIPAVTGLIVAYDPTAVLGNDETKLRVPRVLVVEVIDIPALIRAGELSGANLSRANLSRANLSWANLSGANLSWANLSGANLSGANLSWANLSRANLSRANLSRANLSRANLSGANLFAVIRPEGDLQ